MSLFELSSTHCPALGLLASLSVFKMKKVKLKKKSNYAISTLGNLYICTVNVFDFILSERDKRK